jgi:hypothetical protein
MIGKKTELENGYKITKKIKKGKMDPDGLGDDGPITHTHNSHNTTHN